MKSRDLRLSAVIDAKPAAVYRALTSARELRRWWAADAQAQARSGGRLRLNGRTGHFVDLDLGRKVAWLWSPTKQDKGAPPLNTFFILPRTGTTSAVSLVHAGFSAAASGDKLYSAYAEIWAGCLSKLKDYLEK